MNLPFRIATRYLFAKKSHNAINIISLISVCGVVVATTALVCALSIFNGFTDMATKTFSAFDPQLQITPAEGKVFDPTDARIVEALQLSDIDFTSQSLEENALLKFRDRQEVMLLKGVSPEFVDLAEMNSLLLDGEFFLRDGDVDYGVMGAGLATMLGVHINAKAPLEIYIPKRDAKINMANPATAFTTAHAYTSGVFALYQAKYDDQLLIVSIDLMRELLRYDNEVSSIDIKVKDGASISSVRQAIKSIVGDSYIVKDRFEQQEDTYRMVNIEKWMTSLILFIISIIAIFNVVGSLSMLIIEKTGDINIFRCMGANNKVILRIFMFEGWFITFVGSMVGLALGVIICLAQQHFGILKLGEAGTFIVDAYPVHVEFFDVLLIFVAVNIVGFLAVLYPVNTLRKRL